MKIIILLVSLVVPCIVFAECKDYKIVDHGDYVEAVCVGSPLSISEKIKMEQDTKQMDLEIASQEQKQRESQQREIDIYNLSKTKCKSNIKGDCGPGRSCVFYTMWGVPDPEGVCKTTEEANNIKERSQRAKENSKNIQINNKLDNINNNIDRLRLGY